MATDPQARMTTVHFPKGTIRAPRANIDKLVTAQSTGWGNPLPPIPGTNRRKYGYRRRANAAAGKPITIVFKDGVEGIYRLTGTVQNFIEQVVKDHTNDQVANIVTQRGSEYGAGNFANLI